MSKLDYTHDYYKDLELSPTADLAEIKKQYKKLALKLHPDRNPGEEDVFSPRFQAVQAAYEILSSSELRGKYDARRASGRPVSRYPTASGVKGNPWQNYADAYPPPPKRPPANNTHTSGASRYSNLFPHNMPRASNTAREESYDRWRAWENMKATKPHEKPSTKPAPSYSRPEPPHPRQSADVPPVPPRTPAQKAKAEASFGSRRRGFEPGSAQGDEPPVYSRNYSTAKPRPSIIFNDIPAAAAAAATSRVENESADETVMDFRQSTPYQTHGGERLNPFDSVDLDRTMSAREGHRRRGNDEPHSHASPRSGRPRSSSVPEESDASPMTGPADPPPPSPQRRQRRPPLSSCSEPYQPSKTTTTRPPSQSQVDPNAMSNERPGEAKDGPTVNPTTASAAATATGDSNELGPTPSAPRHSAPNSNENIGAGLAGRREESQQPPLVSPPIWSTNDAFSAAKQSSRAAAAVCQRSKSVPDTSTSTTSNKIADNPPPAGTGESRFDAGQWAGKIGPETFVPLPTAPRPPGSPTRPSRQTKKSRQARIVGGNAAMHDEHSSSEEGSGRGRAASENGHNGGRRDSGVNSPNAMDLDTPPPDSTRAAPGAAGARNIPVEPSRAEWRAGKVGSEDTTEFHNLAATFNNVEPFAPSSNGLDSMRDLGTHLPFESKASARVPIERPHPAQDVKLPLPPPCPAVPPAFDTPMAKPSEGEWAAYVAKFTQYMSAWADYNSMFAVHFSARKRQLDQIRRETSFNWLGTRGDDKLGEYIAWLAEDWEARRVWTAACNEHELHVHQFMMHRERMEH